MTTITGILLVLSLSTLLLLTSSAPTASAPAPSASGINITAILEKAGGCATFIRLLRSTQADQQITNQLKSSTDGMTVFAPTDNAFSTLKPGTLNSLSAEQQVQLIQYHMLSKYYTWDTFQTVSNPVNTQASGRTGNWGVNITTYGVQQVNVSTGVVQTQVNNAIRMASPLAVYQVQMVLLPDELFGPKANAPIPSPETATTTPAAKANSTAASPSSFKNSNGAVRNDVVLGSLAALCMGMFF